MSSGTVMVRGRGQAVVTATGTDSAMGRTAALMTAKSGLTPLQHRMIGVGRALAAAAVVLCAIVPAIGLGRGLLAELMVITAISLVVAAVPEPPPAVVTLALALGARRMTARHALISRLPAVETPGSVTVLGTDKTGTLTEGAMVVGSCGHPPVRRNTARIAPSSPRCFMHLNCENHTGRCPEVPRVVCTVVPASGSRGSLLTLANERVLAWWQAHRDAPAGWLRHC